MVRPVVSEEERREGRGSGTVIPHPQKLYLQRPSSNSEPF